MPTRPSLPCSSPALGSLRTCWVCQACNMQLWQQQQRQVAKQGSYQMVATCSCLLALVGSCSGTQHFLLGQPFQDTCIHCSALHSWASRKQILLLLQLCLLPQLLPHSMQLSLQLQQQRHIWQPLVSLCLALEVMQGARSLAQGLLVCHQLWQASCPC